MPEERQGYPYSDKTPHDFSKNELVKPGLANRIYQAGRVVGGAAKVYKQGAEDLVDLAKKKFSGSKYGL